MKNPWKRLSKINPQPEDGTRRINYKVFDALIKAKLPTAEMSVVLAVISKTWGYNKKSDAISISQLAEITGFTTRAIKKANASLQAKRIIVSGVKWDRLRVNAGSPLNEYLFNKHYDTWKTQDRLRVNAGSRGERSGKLRVNAGSPTIDNITIEKDILAYILCDNSKEVMKFCKNFIEFIRSEKSNLAPKSSDLLKNSCESVDKLIRIDGFELDYIGAVLRWAVQDKFWKNNVLSLSGLRRKKDGLTKFQKIANDFESKKTRVTRGKAMGRSGQNAEACREFIDDMMQECGYHE